MIKILFVYHGTTADSRDLSVLAGQNGAKCGIWTVGYYGFTTIEKTKKRACISSPFPVF